MPEPFVRAYANWRPEKQITDRKVFKSEAADDLRQRACACCGQRQGSTLHHIVPRSQRGDDVLENLVGLCGQPCHDALHHAPSASDLYRAIGQRLTADNIAYVLAKKGSGWLQTCYGVTAA